MASPLIMIVLEPLVTRDGGQRSPRHFLRLYSKEPLNYPQEYLSVAASTVSGVPVTRAELEMVTVIMPVSQLSGRRARLPLLISVFPCSRNPWPLSTR
jgi:hypothetical protein